jgi:hypothetical protein
MSTAQTIVQAVVDQPYQVRVEQESVTVVAVGVQGPEGPKGEAGIVVSAVAPEDPAINDLWLDISEP